MVIWNHSIVILKVSSLSLLITIIYTNFITTKALLSPNVNKRSFCTIRSSVGLPYYAITKQLVACRGNTDPVTEASSSGVTIASLDEDAAVSVIDSLLFPQSEYDERFKAGEVFMSLQQGSSVSVITANDPRLSYTYAEFPVKSFEHILQKAILYVTESELEKPVPKARKNIIDLGSGCGRLCFYAGLTLDQRWNVHGIEISPYLHEVACMSLQRGINEGLFSSIATNNEDMNDNDDDKHNSNTRILFHEGPADNFKNILKDADVIFGYSTAWPAPNFDPEIGAVVLGGEWSTLLARSCKDGCIVITTDRILNTNDGWIVFEKIDVENPELLGSTVYFHKLKI